MDIITPLFKKAFFLAHKNFPLGGTCLEFGVALGRTYLWQANQLLRKYKNSVLVGFDSWEGLPQETDGVWYPSRHSKRSFAYPKNRVVEKLRALDGYWSSRDRFRFVDGFFSSSLTQELQMAIRNVIFVNIDVDVHVSTVQLLDFIKPLLQREAILYWDDWLDPRDIPRAKGRWGEHRAWEEWACRNPEVRTKTVAVNRVNQRMMEIVSKQV